MKLKYFKQAKQNVQPIYFAKPFVLLSDEEVVLAAGTAEEIKGLSIYFDEFWVEVRRHDMHLNDNTKITSKD